jgi:hypothetical protein
LARRYFGTDGVRGVVGEFLTPELVERLGRVVRGGDDNAEIECEERDGRRG